MDHASDDLYKDIYLTLRDLERGVSQVLQPINLRFDLAMFQEQVQGLDPDLPEGIKNSKLTRLEWLYTIPFYAEEKAEIEIVIGLSHVPPYAIPSQDAIARYGDKELVEVRLLNEEGGQSDASMSLDSSSTRTMRVYRLKADGRKSQWYQLRFVPNTDYAATLLDDTVRYTVSIASLRPNVQLNTGIFYQPDRTMPEAPKRLDEAEKDVEARERSWDQLRGTFQGQLPGPVVEVQVYGGTPILGATVKGIFQVLGKSNPLDKFPGIDFTDDGKFPDRTMGDGVYTAQIKVNDTPPGGADYRVAIQAFANRIGKPKRWTENIAFEPSDEASKKRSDENKAKGEKSDKGEAQDRDPVEFQRTTSIHFRVDQ